MKYETIALVFIFAYLFALSANAQIKIGDNVHLLNLSAILELESNSQGFLPARMTSLQRDGIPTPAKGLLLYNTTTNQLEVNFGTPEAPDWNTAAGAIISPADTALWNSLKSLYDSLKNKIDGLESRIAALEGNQDTTNVLTDIDGNRYETIRIGGQVWMKENLRVSRFKNGEQIPIVTDSTWGSLLSSARCWYANDSINNNLPYGNLYNGIAARDSRGICPQGWHVPSDTDWAILTDTLGGLLQAGGALKLNGTQFWSTPNTNATNSSGFSALPGGYRSDHSNFYNIRDTGYYWTSTDYNGWAAFNRVLSFNTGEIARQPGEHVFNAWYQTGASIRCVQH